MPAWGAILLPCSSWVPVEGMIPAWGDGVLHRNARFAWQFGHFHRQPQVPPRWARGVAKFLCDRCHIYGDGMSSKPHPSIMLKDAPILYLP